MLNLIKPIIMIINDLILAWRNIRRSPLYSLLNIGGLALGIACCLLIALYIYDEWSYDRFHVQFKNIYRITEKQQQPDGVFDVAVTPGPLAPALASRFPEVVQTTRIGQWSGVLTMGQQAVEPERMLIVDPSFFTLFSFPLVAGNAGSVFQSGDEVIFSEGMADQFFGADWRKKAVIGQIVQLNKDQNLKLVGVARNAPSRSHIQFDVLLPFKWLEKNDEWSLKWNSNSYHTYIQLRPDASANSAAFDKKIRNVMQAFEGSNDAELFLQPLSTIYLYSDFAFETDWNTRSSIVYIRIFMAVGGIVLLIAIINFINLATARAAGRAKEVGVRKTIGARRSRLIAQFLTEAAVMTGLALLAALVVAQLLLPLFNNIAGKALALPIHLSEFWLLLAALLFVVSLLTGLYPAAFLSSFRPVAVLKGVFNMRSGRSFRQSLVVGQFVLSVVMMLGTAIIYQQLRFLQTTRLGFDKSQLLHVRLKGDLRGKAALFKREVEGLPSVARASLATSNMVNVTNGSNVEWEGQLVKDEWLMTHMNVDADFVLTTGMQLVAGRNFSAQVPSDTSSVMGAFLLNETAVRRMGWTPATALGKEVKFWGQSGKVIGVVKDFHYQSLHAVIAPFILRFRPLDPYFTLLVKTAPGKIQQTLAAITRTYKKLEPVNPITYGFVDQDLDKLYRADQRTGRIVLYFAVLTILISCFGLFGLAAYTAAQRTREIGIRKVLGASVAGIVEMLSRDFLKLVVLAVLIATPIGWFAMNRWLQSFAYRITIEWWLFFLAGLLAVFIALITVGVQAIRAAVANPVKSLRTE